MAEDSSSADEIKQLDKRLNYLESVARETVARLYAMEKHLGLVFRAVPRELDAPPQIDREAQLSRLRAIEEALKTSVPSSQPAPQEKLPAGEPTQPGPPVSKPAATETGQPASPAAKLPASEIAQPDAPVSKPPAAPLVEFKIQRRGQTVSPTGMGAFKFAQIVATNGPMTPAFPRPRRAVSPRSSARAALPLPLAGGVPVSALPLATTADLLLAGWLV